jgi:hypothetical protein
LGESDPAVARTRDLGGFRKPLGQDIPKDLLGISSAKPDDEVGRILGRFNRTGVDQPYIYPYVSGDDAYKIEMAVRLASIVV